MGDMTFLPLRSPVKKAAEEHREGGERTVFREEPA